MPELELFKDIARNRQSIRSFLPNRVPDAILRSVLDDARQALGVARESLDDRRLIVQRNLEFFGAPHAWLLFMPSFYDDVRIARDVGMYAQTFLLSLAAHGLAGVPQTYLGFYADTAREVLGIDPALKMLFGIAFGYPDLSSPAGSYRSDNILCID